ncbi:hypothetical protein TcBrA4_0093540 [Trypanosoma cruzi]|nr:hypothetical protein TcBrA4_0093540 [Trypanosoma cruzi]
MQGALSPIATAASKHTPHENRCEHQRIHHAAGRRHNTVAAPQLNPHGHHHCEHYMQQQQQHGHHVVTHIEPSNTTHGVPLLPPHIHSMLYHSIVGYTAESSLSEGCEDNVGNMKNYLSIPKNCLHTPSQIRYPPQSQTSCELSGFMHSNVGGPASLSSVAAKIIPPRATMITPSPYSENVSVGNFSASPSTTRGCQTTDTKRKLSNSSVVYSPGTSPSKGSGIPSTELTVRALERELRAAEKDELLQVLLELSSCNPEAATFIQSKARLFSFRHTTTTGGKKGENTEDASGMDPSGTNKTTAASVSAKTSQQPQQGLSFGIIDRCSGLVHVTPSKPLAFEEDTSFSNSCEKAASMSGTSPNNLSSRNLSSAQMLLQTPPNHGVTRARGERRCETSQTVVVDAFVRAEDRPWCDKVHPCLRWYGSCRYPTSCPFVSSPQSLCLNWVRGSCVAGSECSGVHRLPDACPSEVLTVFELCHGADRGAVAHEKLQRQPHQQQDSQHGSHYNQQPCIYTDPNLQGRDGFDTPIGQLISDTAGIPASLEHYYHELHYSKEINFPNQQQSKDDGFCHCRSCRTPCEEFELLAGSQEEKSWKSTKYLPPPVAQPIPRCLNDSFAAAESSEGRNTPGVTEKSIWREPTQSLKCQPSAACGAEYEEEASELYPPHNSRTRNQSPVSP